MFAATDPGALLEVAKVPPLLPVSGRALVVVQVRLALALVELDTEDLLTHDLAVFGSITGGVAVVLKQKRKLSVANKKSEREWAGKYLRSTHGP